LLLKYAIQAFFYNPTTPIVLPARILPEQRRIALNGEENGEQKRRSDTTAPLIPVLPGVIPAVCDVNGGVTATLSIKLDVNGGLFTLDTGHERRSYESCSQGGHI
jgi:hypothetical protein